MGLNVARGFINTTTGAIGNTVVVNTLGFTPKVIFFWWNGRVDTTDAVGRRNHQTGFGYAVSTTDRRYATCLSQDTPTAMVTNRMQGNAACIGLTTTADAIDGLMDLQSMDAGGFTLVIDDVFTASYTVHYMALGGTDIVNVGGNNFTTATVTGNQDVEQVAFLPNFITFFHNGQTTINNSVSVDSLLGIGAAKSSTNRYVLNGGSNDAAATSQTVSYSSDAEVIAFINSAVTLTEQRADFVNFHSSPANGFRINWLESAAAAKIVSYVAIQFTNADYVVLGDLLTQTDTTTDIVESGMPFKPLGGMFISHGQAKSTQDTVQDNHELSIGAFDSVSSRSAMGMMDDDAAATAVVGTAVEFDAVYVNLPTTAATIDGLMDIKSIENTGFTAIMDDADPAQAFVWYMAFGPEHLTINATVGTIASAGRTASITPGAVTINATAAVIASAGRTATVSNSGAGQTVNATAGVIASAGRVATITPGAVTVQAVAGTIASAGRTATVTPGAISVTATAATIVSAGRTATVTPGAVTIQASAATLDSDGVTATITPGAISVTASAATLDTNGVTATISNAVTIQASAGIITSAGRTASVTPGAVTVQATVGAITVSGQTASITPGAVSISASAAILDTNGITAAVIIAGSIQATVGTLSLSGRTATVTPGAVTITANAATLDSNGHPATVSSSSGGVTISAGVGAISIAGRTATVIPGAISITAAIGAITVTGYTVTVIGQIDLIVDEDNGYYMPIRDDTVAIPIRETTYTPARREWDYVRTP